MALKAGDAFPDVVETVKPFLVHSDDRDMLPYYFKEEYTQLVLDYPDTVLELLFLTFPEDNRYSYGLRDVLDQLLKVNPEFARDRRYQYLDRMA